MIQISMLDANDFVQSVQVDGGAYKLHFSWNDYAGHWTMDVRTMQSEDMVRGIAIVPNYPLLLRHHRTDGLPRGEFMAVVVDGTNPENQAIGRKDFVTGKFAFVYIPEVEVNAIRNAS